MTPNRVNRLRLLRSPRPAGWPAASRTSLRPPRCPARRARPAGLSGPRRPRRTRARARPVRLSGPVDRVSLPSGESGRAPSSGAALLQPCRERLAGDPLVGVLVALARALDDLVREGWGRGCLVPAGAGRPVAHVLLVE